MDLNKLNKLNIKNFIKNSNSSRLQSLRLPRDLNLSGSKIQQKKVYKPNLNAVRNKNKSEKLRNNEQSKTKNTKHPEKLKERFVQSTGVFSEGIGPHLHTITKSEKQNRKDIKSSKKSDVINLQLTHSINDSSKHIVQDSAPNHLKIDKNDSDSEEYLAFTPSIWDNTFLDVKQKIDITNNKLPTEYGYTKDMAHQILTLWQLPDSFAYKGKKSSDFALSDIPKGQIGKISVHKSGKYNITIGNTNYLLDSTLHAPSEDVVCLTNETKESFVLDEIKNRFILSPDWNFLL